MSVARPGVKVEIELGSYGSDSWTDITADVRMGPGVRIKRGIRGTGPKDRTSGVGTTNLVLDNSGANSGGLTGYYSPDNANLRSGFSIGKRVRTSITSSGAATLEHIGTINSIKPQPGSRRDRGVAISCVDWFEEAARWKLRGIPIQTNQRADELIGTVIDEMPRLAFAPTRVFSEGQSTFVYAIDNALDESHVALTEFARAVQSEFGYFYATYITGEKLIFEDRHDRLTGAGLTNAYTFSDTMCEMSVRHAISDVYNRIQVTAHPRRLGDSDSDVLYTLEGTPSVGPGETITIRGPYTDPSQRAVRIGALSTQTITATTDYTANTLADGSGTDRTADITVSVVVSANSAEFTVTNNGTSSAFLTKLQIRGQAIFDYSPAIAEAVDDDSIDAYGERTLKVDMPYQDSSVLAQAAADFFLALYKAPRTYVDSITICGSTSKEILDTLLAIDIGTRIGIAETVTGLAAADGDGRSVGYFVHAVDIFIGTGNEIWFTFSVVPATDAAQQWILGMTGSSELGETTYLVGF